MTHIRIRTPITYSMNLKRITREYKWGFGFSSSYELNTLENTRSTRKRTYYSWITRFYQKFYRYFIDKPIKIQPMIVFYVILWYNLSQEAEIPLGIVTKIDSQWEKVLIMKVITSLCFDSINLNAHFHSPCTLVILLKDQDDSIDFTIFNS